MSLTRKLKNTTESQKTYSDLGDFKIAALATEDITNIFITEQLFQSTELFTDIDNGDIVVNNGQRDLPINEGKAYCTPSTDKPRENPLPYIYLAQANTLNSLFELHTEAMELEDALEKCYVDFFDSNRKVSDESNILFDGQGIYLYGNSITDSMIEDFDDIIDWSEDTDYNNEIASISLDTSEKHEGTGSLKMTFLEVGKFNTYGIKKIFTTAQDWSAYECLNIYNKISSANDKYCFCMNLKDSSGNNFITNIAKFNTDWSEIIFDLLGCSFRNDIKEVDIYVMPNCATDLNINFDQLKVSKINSYQTSGHITSQNIETTADIEDIYFNIYGNTPQNTDIESKISLDGGNHWHDITDAEYDCWIDVTAWSEYSSFDNLKNIKVKILLNSTDGINTSLVDDFLIQWKVKI